MLVPREPKLARPYHFKVNREMAAVFRNSKFSVNVNLALAYGTIAATMLVGLANISGVDGASAMYVFGDSYVDTGNFRDLSAFPPYGSIWPGYPAGRFNEGRNLADCIAELFDLPYPTPYLRLENNSEALRGVNFARSGAGVTYAYGLTALVSQVDEIEALVEKHVLTKAHLRKSVALVNIGVNDYHVRNRRGAFQEHDKEQELHTTITTIVDGIALSLVRLYGLGVRNIVVSNLALMACAPFVTEVTTFTSCSRNATLLTQTSLHNSLLQQRVKTLNRNLGGLHIILVDQTKAFEVLFHHGSEHGFENTMTPCCIGKAVPHGLVCGHNDTAGHPMYTLCEDPSKHVLFDTIHPSEAAWQTAVDLFAHVDGFTVGGPTLRAWMSKHGV
ncbi:GDSL esterase/lipase At3g09930 isoform X1 [Physcomitrium patens]|uniref:GDSL esterase/lipase n=2 Tax=Physcomitrium patens TaxID=3218 RepID=A0A7I4FKZ2_PHYPA|nr:GDSL esterase/lipase At3g09930-like isoform X1 [Physcomitrium patens]|eukprot:XP_024369129.1 GDSL esterase/lipase At3g09930-like isoform X1 [Physcomitrella patens]